MTISIFAITMVFVCWIWALLGTAIAYRNRQYRNRRAAAIRLARKIIQQEPMSPIARRMLRSGLLAVVREST